MKFSSSLMPYGRAMRSLLSRFYSTYPSGGKLLNSTRSFEREMPRHYRLVCKFMDQETSAAFVWQEDRIMVASATSEERPLRHRILDARDYTTWRAVGQLLGERAVIMRVHKATYGGSVGSFRNKRYEYYFDQLHGILDGLTSQGIQMEIDVAKLLQSVSQSHQNRVLYDFLLPLRSMPGIIQLSPDGERLVAASEKPRQQPNLLQELFPNEDVDRKWHGEDT